MSEERTTRAGLTLVEVLLATAILGVGLAVLLVGASRCMATIRAARNYQTAQWVLSQGEAVHFVVVSNDVKELDVPADTDLAEGFTFSRTVEADDDEDGLYEIRTRVTWSDRGRELTEEVAGMVLYWDEEKAKR
jgi:prepilin-type N-terminal cleavage/methylation domain-containing protein